MNMFIDGYLERLRAIRSDQDVIDLYHWFWSQQEAIRQTTEAINDCLGLAGDCMVQPDLPCLTMGSRAGLLFVFLNPSWSQDLNALEDAYCRRSRDSYVDFFFNFFTLSPGVYGRHLRYSANMISFIGILRDGVRRFGEQKTTKQRWQRAQDSRLVGHWELFPFHSSNDGLSVHMHQDSQHPWLYSCAKESVLAALRLEPELMFAVSKPAWDILRNQIFRDQTWQDIEIGTPATRLSYCRVAGRSRETEIVAIRRQLLSSHRICTNPELFSQIDKLRASSTA